MRSINVRPATSDDSDSLLKMPCYCSHKCDFVLERENILVAENANVICGAVSASSNDISVVYGDWREGFDPRKDNLIKLVSKGWISKLYVLPEHRGQGIGIKLVHGALGLLEKKNFAEAYVGIYIKNQFYDTSHHIFERVGFEEVGSCICLLAEGYCRGTLLKKATKFNQGRKKERRDARNAFYPQIVRE